MGFVRLAIFCSVLAGCSAPPVVMPGQDTANAIVWRSVYHQTHGLPVEHWDNNCLGPHGEQGLLYDGTCLGGTYGLGWEIDVAWTGKFSASAFAHELLHAKQALVGIYNYNHDDAEWMFELPAANAALMEAGL